MEGFENGLYVLGHFKLTTIEERNKQRSPLLIKIRSKTVVPTLNIESEVVANRADGSIDVNKTIYNSLYKSFLKEDETNTKKINEQKSILGQQKSVLTELEENKTKLIDEVSEIQQSIKEKELNRKVIEKELNDVLEKSQKDKGEIMKQIDRLNEIFKR